MSSATESIGRKIAETLTKRVTGYPGTDKSKTKCVDGIFLSSKTLNLFMHICSSPCIWTRKAARDMGCKVSSISQCSSKLVKVGLVERHRLSHKVIFIPVGMVDEKDIGIIAMLKNAVLKKVMAMVYDKPGMAYSELSTSLQMPVSTIKHNFSTLSGLGLVSSIRDGRVIRSYPTSVLQELRKKYTIRRHAFTKNVLNRLRIMGLNPHIETTIGQKIMINVVVRGKSVSILMETNPLTNI